MLNIYTSESVAALVSDDFTTPLVTAHNKKVFMPHCQKLYLRNDSVSEWYSNIQISATSTQGQDIYSGTGSFGIKFSVGSDRPPDRSWALLPFNEPIDFQPIGTVALANTSTFYPFWIRVEAGADAAVSFYQGQLKVSCVAHGV